MTGRSESFNRKGDSMTNNQPSTEAGWHFDNSYARLPDLFFTEMQPNPVDSPRIVMLNKNLADELGLKKQALQGETGAAVLSFSERLNGTFPVAQAYAGHQFGHLAMLGDGRAVLLGEHITPDGRRVDIGLKGSGRTPYSRGGDGRAALGPMLREYIISEAMHALGIPTSRSLAVVATGEDVYRETALPGAVLTRTAASHLRVGTFQYAIGAGGVESVQALADYAIDRHYPHLEAEEKPYVSFLREVVNSQAALIAKWQLVGFIHGVMNTDNMTISGETIDYGPCAFMDTYHPKTVFSSIDAQGRYRYENQPIMASWNLARFAETLLPLIHDDQEKAVPLAQAVLSEFGPLYEENWQRGMRAKLGLAGEEKEDEELIQELLELMKEHKADYTNTFRALTIGELQELELFSASAFQQWHERWQERRVKNQSVEASTALMKQTNPSVIPRNHRVEEALEAAVARGDMRVMEQLLTVLGDPFAYSSEQEAYTSLPQNTLKPYRTFCGT